MDIVLIFNGLGNQMSQYAFYLAKRQRNNHTVYCVLGPRTQYSLDKLFDIPYRHNAVLVLLYRALDKAHFSNHRWLRRLLRPTLRLLGVKMIVEPLARLRHAAFHPSKRYRFLSRGMAFRTEFYSCCRCGETSISVSGDTRRCGVGGDRPNQKLSECVIPPSSWRLSGA